VSLAFPVVGALALGLVLGGRLGNLARLRLRASWLFFVAIALQVVAFPVAFLPWRMDAGVASVLWLTSYGFLIVAAFVNRRVTGVPIVALGMCMNVAAIVANGATMPVSRSAMHDAGRTAVTQANSTAVADPRLGWLADRWAAPDWIPLANVFSVGDVVIAAGAVVIVLHAMGVRIPRLRREDDLQT
jgi:Family of unknown function (DUF5317)